MGTDAPLACQLLLPAQGSLFTPLAPLLLCSLLARSHARKQSTECKMAQAMPTPDQLAALEATLGYAFEDRQLLTQALLHPSLGGLNNQRMAWLGDGLLKAITSDQIFQQHPAFTPIGVLHRQRKVLEMQALVGEGAGELHWGPALEAPHGPRQARPSGGTAFQGLLPASSPASRPPTCRATWLAWRAPRAWTSASWWAAPTGACPRPTACWRVRAACW